MLSFRSTTSICTSPPSSPAERRSSFPNLQRWKRPSRTRKSGRPESPTIAAVPRVLRNRRTPAAATSTTAFILPTGRSSSSKPSPTKSPGRTAKSGFAATPSGPSPNLNWRCSSIPNGRVIGYTIGNDISSRDIEGANPLYLPQAKVYDRSCALGPGILIQPHPMPVTTEIRMEILRAGIVEYSASTALTEMKRDPAVLVEYLFRDQSFPRGCFLLTGTGIVPPDSFTLRSGDEVHISIDGIGTLMNQVATNQVP